MKKICVVTSTRAEYGLLYWLIKEIDADKDLQLQLIVTGAHLEKEFGHTQSEIQKEFKIDYKIPLELSDDSTTGIANSMALATTGFANAYQELSPDLIILLGDRYEIFCAASSALISQIPVAHLHGGELTYGAFDDAFRHSISKMSHLHFCATQEYKNRIIQMGENPTHVFNVGGMGIENIKKLQLLSKNEFEESINFVLGEKNLLITYHPETLSNISVQKQFQNILDILDTLENTKLIFTYANSDTDGKTINQMIENYITNHPNAVCFKSLGQLRYLSALQYVDGVLGNSSSGILEVPSFKTATINIGYRQKGRIQAKSIINTPCKKEDIKKALDRLYCKEFQEILTTVTNPYDNGNTSTKVLEIIKSTNLEKLILKTFYDIKGN